MIVKARLSFEFIKYNLCTWSYKKVYMFTSSTVKGSTIRLERNWSRNSQSQRGANFRFNNKPWISVLTLLLTLLFKLWIQSKKHIFWKYLVKDVTRYHNIQKDTIPVQPPSLLAWIWYCEFNKELSTTLKNSKAPICSSTIFSRFKFEIQIQHAFFSGLQLQAIS